MSLEEQFTLVHGACESNLSALFHNDADFVPVLTVCTKVLTAIAHLGMTYTNSSPAMREFCSHDLAIVADVALRRKTLRENVKHVGLFLDSLARFLAEAIAQDMPNAMNILYLIWDGAGVPYFLDLQKVGVTTPMNTYGSLPFYVAHGKPCTAYKQGKMIYFWPDEEELFLGAEEAVGHRLGYFDVADGIWKEGDVVAYDMESKAHTLDVLFIVPGSPEGQSQRVFKKLQLSQIEHYWADTTAQLKQGTFPVIRAQILSFTEADVGTVVRIWWARYQKYFYGTVSSFDLKTRHHTITYEDNDIRVYDMSQKDYEVLNLANDPALPAVSDPGRRAGAAAKMIRATTATPGVDTRMATPRELINGNTSSEAGSATLAPRPQAVAGFSTSEHLLRVINLFAAAKGFENIFERLADTSRPPPAAEYLVYYLRLLAQLRTRARPGALRELVWEAKECVPSALLRFGDQQLKSFTKDQLSEITVLLQELVMIVAAAKVPIQESLDRLGVQLALKMLQCSQLQKRFLGLTHMRTVIEQAYPRVMNFARRRSLSQNTRSPKGMAATSAALAGGPSAALMRTARPTTLNANFLEDWLLENRVVEIMFGESMHTELVSRCDVVLMFLALRGALLPRHLCLIWKSCLGSHEAVARVVHPLLLDVIPVLSPTLRTSLFSEICSLPFHKYTAQTLHLIKEFTVRALKAYKKELATATPPDGAVHPTVGEIEPMPDFSEESQHSTGSANGTNGQPIAGSSTRKGQVVHSSQRQWLGFGLLWQFIQDRVGAPQESASGNSQPTYVSMIDVAVDLLVELLAETDFKDERDSVMQRCIENVARHRSVPASLSLLRKVLATIPAQNRAWFGGRKSLSLALTIEHLQRSHDLLGLFFQDLQFYHETFTAAVFGRGGPSGAEGGAAGVATNAQSDATSAIAPSSTTISSIKPNRSVVELAALNEKRIRIQGSSSRHPHIKQVSERLEFMTFILGNSGLLLNEQHTSCLWECFVAQAPNPETARLVLMWFDKIVIAEDKGLRAMLQSVKYSIDLPPGSLQLLAEGSAVAQLLQDKGDFKVFADGVLSNFFSSRVVKYIGLAPSEAAARVFLKLFLHVNLANKSIRTDSDGTWTRQGEPVGLKALWTLSADAENEQVSEAATVLLIELYHRLSSKLKSQADEIRGYFIRRCLSSLSTNIQCLKGDIDEMQRAMEDGEGRDTMELDPAVEVRQAAGVPLAGAAGVSSNSNSMWNVSTSSYGVRPGPPSVELIARRVTRYVRLLQRFINRFGQDPQQFVNVQIRLNRDGPVITELRVRLSDTVGHLRKLVAEHFNESAQSVVILKQGPSRMGFSTQDALSNDEQTLRQAKFSLKSAVIARKREKTPAVVVKKPAVGTVAGSTATPPSQDLNGAKSTQDLIQPHDLKRGFREASEILRWLAPRQDAEGDSEESTPELGSEYALKAIMSFPRAPLPHKSDMVLVSLEDVSKVGLGAKSQQEDDTGIEFRRLVEFVGPYLTSRPDHFDQLFSMLDGFLSTEIQGEAGFDVAAAVWDVLQRFPTHATLLRQLRELQVAEVGHFRQLIDANSLYKMLYSLQILDAFISSPSAGLVPLSMPFSVEATISPSNDRATRQWASKFLHLGGTEHLGQAFQTQIRSVRDFLPVDGNAPSGYAEEDSTNGKVSRLEAYVLSMTLLSRVLYAFLLLDPAFSVWQPGVRPARPEFRGMSSRSLGVTGPPSATTNSSTETARGVIFSSIDVHCILHEGMDCLLRLTKSRANISERALGTYTEHYMMLAMGCAMASDQGLALLCSYRHWHVFLKVMCLRHPFRSVREGACRRIFNSILYIHMKDTSPIVNARRELCGFILKSLLLSFHPDFFQDTGIPHVSSSASMTDEVAGEDANGEKKSPSKSVSLQDHAHAEQAYSLIGMIFALQVFPEQAVPVPESSTIWKPPEDSMNWTKYYGFSFSPLDLCVLFTQLLLSHKPVESFHNPSPDGTLVGILRVCLVLAHNNTEAQRFICEQKAKSKRNALLSRNLLEVLYCDCLFPERAKKMQLPLQNALGLEASLEADEQVDGAVCKTSTTRFLVYALLYELCGYTGENFEKLVEVMLRWAQRNGNFSGIPIEEVSRKPVLFHGKSRKHWEYDPTALLKEVEEYVGLVNQGATCYMNSLMQQLYHTQPFSTRVLTVDDTSESLEDSVLFQLQVLFGYLRLSQKRFYDTLPFCKAFRDYDGQPIALNEQKDANEFCSMLFEKLESIDPKVATLIKDSFVGTLSWVVTSTESKYKSERLEPFYTITAEVKNKKSLEESLELFISPEIMTGDNKVMDSDLNKKVDAERRCAIRELPSTLIIHFKRFDFNIETMTRTKVNDYCSFPMELDMLPYTEEGVRTRTATVSDETELQLDAMERITTGVARVDAKVEDEEDLSRLTADTPATKDEEGEEEQVKEDDSNSRPSREESYYKYILTGVVAHTGTADSGHYYSFIRKHTLQGDKWFEFNDRVCVPFSEELIPKECFGGFDVVHTHAGATVHRERMNNAYLLFYTRTSDYTAQHQPQTQAQGQVSAQSTATASGPAVAEAIMNAGPLLSADAKQSTPFSHEYAQGELERGSTEEEVEDEMNAVLNGTANETITETSREDEKPEDNLVLRQGSTEMLLSTDESAPARNDVESKVSRQVLQAVWSENFEFLTDLNLFEKTHTRLVWNMMTAPSIFEHTVEDLERSASQPDLNVIRARVCILGLQFACEVLSHARALSCVYVWFERIEQIVSEDTTCLCARSIITELSRTRPRPPPPESPTAGSLMAQPAGPRSHLVDEGNTAKPHPWLVEMFCNCPHPATVEAFQKLVRVCVSALRRKSVEEAERAGLEEPSAADYPPKELGALIESLLLSIEEHRRVPTQTHTHAGTQFQIGLKYASICIYSLALMGPLERRELLLRGGLWRIVCVCIALRELDPSGGAQQECVALIECACVLARSSIVAHGMYYDSQKHDANGAMEAQNSTPARVEAPFMLHMTVNGELVAPLLSHSDLSAFLNRAFVEDASLCSGNSYALGLRHVVHSLGNCAQTMTVHKTLVERTIECTMVKGTTSTNYRSYVKVLSELLILPHATELLLEPGPPDESAISRGINSNLLEFTLGPLVQRAERIVTRLAKSDAEFVYSICKLMYKVGTCSSDANMLVRKMLPRVRAIRLAYNREGRRGSGPSMG